jgi:hypothetical protein
MLSIVLDRFLFQYSLKDSKDISMARGDKKMGEQNLIVLQTKYYYISAQLILVYKEVYLFRHMQ